MKVSNLFYFSSSLIYWSFITQWLI